MFDSTLVWRKLSNNPKQKFKWLIGGSLIFFVGVVLLYWAAAEESQNIFYCAILVMVLGFLWALPGYLGILAWRIGIFLNR